MNNQIKVLITVEFAQELLEQIQAVSPRLEVISLPTLTPEELPEDTWEGVEVLYTNKVLPEPEQASDLRWIQFHRAGNERLIDAPILRKPDLVATTLSGASAPQVAEYVLGMILSLGHHTPEIIDFQKQRVWPADRGERFSPQELNQSTVGIIGYGSIGREVARLCCAFGAKVLATKADAKNPEDPGYGIEGIGDPGGDSVHLLYPPQALISMLKECDYVVVAVPLTPETRNLIAAEELDAMKSSTYLVDISRGGVVDHSDLIEALRAGRLAGAALDVFPEEPLSTDSQLWGLPNVILSPHIAGMTARYDERAADLFVGNLDRYLAGEDLLNQIDLERGY